MQTESASKPKVFQFQDEISLTNAYNTKQWALDYNQHQLSQLRTNFTLPSSPAACCCCSCCQQQFATPHRADEFIVVAGLHVKQQHTPTAQQKDEAAGLTAVLCAAASVALSLSYCHHPVTDKRLCLPVPACCCCCTFLLPPWPQLVMTMLPPPSKMQPMPAPLPDVARP
jgi:hypothetical protein